MDVRTALHGAVAAVVLAAETVAGGPPVALHLGTLTVPLVVVEAAVEGVAAAVVAVIMARGRHVLTTHYLMRSTVIYIMNEELSVDKFRTDKVAVMKQSGDKWTSWLLFLWCVHAILQPNSARTGSM